ncbi:MAG: hypothetical protein WC515_05920 [Candidatus Omnitrophota bacterium]
MRRRLILTLIAAVYLISGPAYAVPAEEKAALPREEVATRSVVGIVSGVSPSFIAIEYGIDQAGPSLELAFNIDKSVKVENKRSIKEIAMGDTVEVTYGEITRIAPDGKKLGSKRVAKKVTFMRPAAKPSESSVLTSVEQ